MRNFILLSTFSALFLSFIAVGAQNSPIPGTYFIVNSVPSSAGDNLAATFQGAQQDVIVTPGPMSGSETQRWIISDIDANGAQFIIPVTGQSDAAAANDNNVVVLLKNTFAWTIRNVTSEFFTITSPQSQLWDLDNLDDNANIVLGQSTGSPSQTQSWVLDLLE